MDNIVSTPWDQRVYGIDTYELNHFTEDVLEQTERIPGHFVVRVPPLASKKGLHNHDFYYCDTLIEPYCHKDAFQPEFDERASVFPGFDPGEAARFCLDGFQYDQFHRDFNLDGDKADIRYANWLKDIAIEGDIFSLRFEGALAGFFAYKDNRILLHAMAESFRGKGLAKYFWSDAFRALYAQGWTDITSSVSAANVVVLNLYRSLGFSFYNPVDIYHKYNPTKI